MNRLVRLGSSIQELSKTQSFKFWFDYVKPKYGQKRCLCIWIQMFHCIRKKNDIYKDLPQDVETRSDTSNYKLYRPLPKEKYKK